MKIIGHRGARGLAPENTLASLQKALEYGADGVEFDVRVTKDYIPVLSHNPLTQEDFLALKARKPDIATFKEALEVIGNKALLFIEVKPAEDVNPIMAALKKKLKEGLPSENVFILSFSFKILKSFRTSLPEVNIMVNESWSGVRASYRARKLKTPYIDIGQRGLWPGFIKATAKRHQLYTYTLNDPAKAARWKRYGLAGVITDYPDRFAKS